MSDDSGRNPLEGVPPERRDWHQGALDGDRAVCGAAQPGRPGFPCIWNTGPHAEHQDVFGNAWPAGSSDHFTGARKVIERGHDVTVQTTDHGPVTIAEPVWCLGVHGQDGHRSDIWHAGEEVPLLVSTPSHGPVPLMTAQLVQKPFATDAAVRLAVVIDGEAHELSSVQVRVLADEVVSLGMGRLHELAARIEGIEGGAL